MTLVKKPTSERCKYCLQFQKVKNKCCIWSIYHGVHNKEDWDTIFFKDFIKNYPFYEYKF